MGLLSWWRNLWGVKPTTPAVRRGGELTADYETPPALSMPTHDYELRFGVWSTRGNVRRRNEDNYYVPGRPSLQNGVPASNSSLASDVSTSGLFNPDLPLFIVADGMGGQLAGERASQLAVELIPSHLGERVTGPRDDEAIREAIVVSIDLANEEVLSQSSIQPEYANMGTTVALVLFANRHAFVTGLGDSRVYHVNGSNIRQLTKDHSLAHALGEAGTISSAEVETHKFKNILYLFLGSRDVHDRPEPVHRIDFARGDQFVLASDGLTGVVKDDQIVEILNSTDDPQRAAQSLVNRALDNQSKDNITVVVIRVV